MARTSRVPDKYASDTKVRHFRKGKNLVTVTIEVRPAIIDFQDIVAACQVEEDPDCKAPWEDGDGWEHETVPEYRLNIESNWSHSIREVVHDCTGQRLMPAPVEGEPLPPYEEWPLEMVPSERSVWVNHYNADDVVRVGPGDRRLILVSFAQAREWLGGPQPGEHKQVYWERLADFRRRNLEQLKKWYRDGWRYFVVDCEFLGCRSSLGGIQTKDDSLDDPYLNECCEEVAEDVANELEKVGYIVVNRPDYNARRASRAAKQAHLRRKAAYRLGFETVEEYRQWLTQRTP